MKGAVQPILLAEDDSNDVLLVQRAMRRAQIAHPLRHVEDGQQAMDYLAGQGAFADRACHPLPAVVLLDLKLPRFSGHEVLAWLRQQPGLRRLPVVVLTSSRLPLDLERAYDLGVNSYLVKPPDPERLTELMRQVNSYWLNLNAGPEIVRP